MPEASSLLATRVVARSPTPLTATIDDEIVMLCPDQGVYFGLNPVGSRIWQLLGQPSSVTELCAALTAEFDIDHDTCHAEVLSFLHELAEARLVTVGG